MISPVPMTWERTWAPIRNDVGASVERRFISDSSASIRPSTSDVGRWLSFHDPYTIVSWREERARVVIPCPPLTPMRRYVQTPFKQLPVGQMLKQMPPKERVI
jgi:hypothetical protein